MDFGALMFFTDYAISAVDLARALGARVRSVWARALAYPDLAQDAVSGGGTRNVLRRDGPVRVLWPRRSPTKLKVGTGVCLVHSATRSRRQSWSPRSESRTASFYSASAAAGTG